ncbi:MAG: MlaD family protein [Phycisphaerales bacterium]|jgi:ABC-type transporter Mla subunit MlaD|nr:MlaD family protein [Phycisphaerales bacterium]
MSQRSRDTLIGIAAIAAVVSMILLLQLFGEIDTVETWRLTLRAPSTSGITDSSRVTLDGVPIGSIESVESVPTGPWPVRITAAIDEEVEIPVGVTTLTSVSLLTGSANLYLESPANRTGRMIPTDGSAELTGQISPAALRDITAAIDERLGPPLMAINKLGEAWAPVGDGLASLLGTGDERSEGGIPGVIARADAVLASAQSWLDDPELRRDASELMHMALASVDRAVSTLESLGGLVENLDTRSETVTTEIAGAGRALAETLHQASGIMTRIQEGEGTTGQLVTNPDLYNRLTETAKQLDRLTESLRLLVEQVREEGVGPLISP